MMMKDKEIYLPNKESVNGHRCEGTNVATKCEMFMNHSKTFIGICKKKKKKDKTAKQGVLKRS